MEWYDRDKSRVGRRRAILRCLHCFWWGSGFPLWLAGQAPGDFVDIRSINPSIQVELRYYSTNNFVGDTIDGYEAEILYLSTPAAQALDQVQRQLEKKGLGLKIYDGYRPQRAVNHFIRWSQNLEDTVMKPLYYPHEAKSTLFEQGYIAARSGHSRGSTVDLTIVDLETGEPLDMGGPWDFFGEISHHGASAITSGPLQNRLILKSTMELCGFRAYSKEWWHYTFEDEPYSDTYFDFIIR